ncbi:hypothetical protein [Coprobacter secundus]|uniref:hypothetical protein n=1 Tax=Coprobacter secundus TaxID=1501392 RepID=UPI00190D6791|nr:hypothetical protein [Coprobacter secundus]
MANCASLTKRNWRCGKRTSASPRRRSLTSRCRLEAKLDILIAKRDIQAVRGEKNNVSAPSQAVKGCVCILGQRYSVILPASGTPCPSRSVTCVDMSALYLAGCRCNSL